MEALKERITDYFQDQIETLESNIKELSKKKMDTEVFENMRELYEGIKADILEILEEETEF